VHIGSQLNILNYESSRISKKTLRKLQDHQTQGRYPGDLHQRPPQAAAGLIHRILTD
jgi:hypothetical protein